MEQNTAGHAVLGAGAIEWLGVAYKTILASSETNGAISVVDSVSPVCSGPPRHVHRAEDETFVLLSGSCLFWVEGETFTRGAGEAVFVPRGKEHTFCVVGDEPCRHLVILTPGGFEAFFSAMAESRCRIPEDMERVNAEAARHNLVFTGPPIDARHYRPQAAQSPKEGARS
jgi:quercetin dioxygenase-like cupin family protein